MLLTFNTYCLLQEELQKQLEHAKLLKSTRLTYEKALNKRFVINNDQWAQLKKMLYNTHDPLPKIARLLIFWHYDSYETIYEDYEYAFQRIVERSPKERFEKFCKIYPI